MSQPPATVNAAAALEGLEGLVAAGFAGFVAWELLAGTAVDPASAIGVTVLALAGGIGMVMCARGLRRADTWSRAPTVLTQLFALPVAWSLWQGEHHVWAVLVGLVAVAALVLVLSPASTGWLVETPTRDESEDADGKSGERDG